jgi:hypothetical protein
MKNWLLLGVAALMLLTSGMLTYQMAFAVNANPTVGSVWTWLGPTFGADWVSPAPSGTTGAASSSCASILDFGGKGDDAFDNTAAWNAAKSNARCIVFPAGVFQFNSPITYELTTNHQGLTIFGQGQDVTVLHWVRSVDKALTITKNQFDQSVHIRDLTFTTGQHDADTAIYVNNVWPGIVGLVLQAGLAPNDVTRVTFRSDEGYTTGGPGAPTVIHNSWKNGIYIFQDSVWNFNEILMYGPTPPSGGTPSGFPTSGGGAGYGILLEGNSDHILPIIYNIDRSNFQWLENGILIRAWIQGVNVSQSNFTGNFAGIAVPSGVIGMAQLTVTGSQFQNAFNVWVRSRVQQLMLSNNIFYVPYGGYGLVYETTPFEGTVVTGNYFLGSGYNGGTGIVFNPTKGSTDMPPVVSGNGFFSLLYGIDLRGALTGLVAGNNVFGDPHGARIVNTSAIANAPFNSITGPGNSPYGQPIYASVSGAVSNGQTPPSPRVTVDTTTGFVNGQMALAGGMIGLTGAGANVFKTTSIVVIDATHMDLVDLLWLPENIYASGGSITSLPP